MANPDKINAKSTVTSSVDKACLSSFRKISVLPANKLPIYRSINLPPYRLLPSSGLFTNKIVQAFDQVYLGVKFVPLVMKAPLNIDIYIFLAEAHSP